MRSAAFNTLSTALLLVISILPLQSLGDQEFVNILAKLDPSSPEYDKCMRNECAPYLNVTSVCDVLKTDGNYTWDPKIAERNFLRCACPSPQYLPGLQTYVSRWYSHVLTALLMIFFTGVRSVPVMPRTRTRKQNVMQGMAHQLQLQPQVPPLLPLRAPQQKRIQGLLLLLPTRHQL